MTILCPQAIQPPSPPAVSVAPLEIPQFVYRVHRASAQTRYAFSKGFFSKNQTTILNSISSLLRFGLAHLNQQTNVSSPFISVYDDLTHAEKVAKHWAQKYAEDTFLVTVDTQHFARGPVFRAVDLLENANANEDGKVEGNSERGWLHCGEYLVLYRIPAQAIRDETPVARGENQRWRAVGVIGDV